MCVYVCVCVCVVVYIYTYFYICVYIHLCALICRYTSVCVCVCVHICMHAYIYTYMRIWIFTYMHIYIYIAHTHSQEGENGKVLKLYMRDGKIDKQLFKYTGHFGGLPWGIGFSDVILRCFGWQWEACRGAIGINFADDIPLSTVSSAYSNLSQGGEKVISTKNFESFVWHHVSMEKYTNR